MITTVVFDLDDTLYDELDYCRSGFKAVALSLSNLVDVLSPEEIFDSLWKQFTAGNHTNTFNAALDDLGLSYDDRLIEKLIETYRSHSPQILLPADSEKVLRQLSKKYTLALLTDGFLPAQQLKVQALKIENYFKCIIYTEQLGRQFWKPSPTGFEKLMQTLNAKPQAIAYVADNEKKDFIAPNKLGFLTVQITRPARIHTSVSDAPNASAKHVISKITQLPALLEKL
ncbi:MAG: HAD family hydrolase [Phycisphaerae bacterium]|nr:HAD family hydrolase [Phycisphaerae bacterium]MDD5381295.1 HAD family hydrolase [Phycisphaerae bacterium]